MLDNRSSAPDRLAVIAADGVFSYFDLAQTAERVAAGIAGAEGDIREARVAFLVPPSFAYVAIARGIWLAGGVAVPLAVSHPPAELEHVIRDSGASVVIASGRQSEALEAIAGAAGASFVRAADLLAGGQVCKTESRGGRSNAQPPIPNPQFPIWELGVGSWELGLRPDPREVPIYRPDPGRRSMILYTSGTTGKPKGVVTTHGNLAAQIASLLDAWEWTSNDRALSVLPLHHVHGIVNVIGCALAAGASCEILPQFEVDAAWARLASGDITVFSAVPTIYHRLIAAWDAAPPAIQRARSEGARRVRLMMSGSAALPRTTLERWRAITGHTLLERYGMTELGMVLSNPLHGERRPGYVGAPLPGVETRLVDGEIEVRGPGVFLEYWQRPAETREAFHDGWFRTGDEAVLEDGAYRLLGRRSVDIIKTGGYKVSALEIEDLLRTHPAIGDCSVTGVADEEWGEIVQATVELEPGSTLSLDELQEWAKALLAPYKIPRRLHSVGALPRNAMGKVVKPKQTRP